MMHYLLILTLFVSFTVFAKKKSSRTPPPPTVVETPHLTPCPPTKYIDDTRAWIEGTWVGADGADSNNEPVVQFKQSDNTYTIVMSVFDKYGRVDNRALYFAFVPNDYYQENVHSAVICFSEMEMAMMYNEQAWSRFPDENKWKIECLGNDRIRMTYWADGNQLPTHKTVDTEVVKTYMRIKH